MYTFKRKGVLLCSEGVSLTREACRPQSRSFSPTYLSRLARALPKVWYNEKSNPKGGAIMSIEIDAIYHDGALHPQQPVPLAEGAHVRVAIKAGAPPASGDPLASVIGVGEGPAAGDVANRHDDYLYGRL
jgi:predicted DNA-binding antitoxin AbrB/MazE fold protein